MKSVLSFLLASASLCPAGGAQEAPLPERDTSLSDVGAESLGDALLVVEAGQGQAIDAAEAVDEPPSEPVGGEAGRRGRWRWAPHLQMRGAYDDNIFIQPRNQVADYILTFAPGLAIGFWDSEEEQARYLDRHRDAAVTERSLGTFLVVDYTAFLLGFARAKSQNALDHDALIDARWERQKLTLGARFHLESKSETNADIGGRIQRKTASASVTSSYQFTEKTALGVALFHTTNAPEDFVSTVEWRSEGSLDYAATPLVRFGFGAAAGRVQAEAGAEQIFERLLARAAYALSEKLEAEFRGGVEFRQSDGRAGDRTNPVWELRAGWTPAAGTQVGLEAFRRVETSAFRAEQYYTLTGAALSVRQALSGGFHLGLEGGCHLADYATTLGEDARRDRYLFVRPGVFYSFASWGSAGFRYEHRRNVSTRGASGFENNQTSVELALSY